MARTARTWPRWIDEEDTHNLREVAPNLYVGAEYAPLTPPTGHPKWELVVDWYGSSERYPSRVRGTAKRTIAIPFLDGDVFPPGGLDHVVPRVQVARRRGPVLVHCQAGLSRSASATYAILRKICRLSHAEALRRVKADPEFPRVETLRSARAWVDGPRRAKVVKRKA